MSCSRVQERLGKRFTLPLLLLVAFVISFANKYYWTSYAFGAFAVSFAPPAQLHWLTDTP
jgi:hypothetical protein